MVHDLSANIILLEIGRGENVDVRRWQFYEHRYNLLFYKCIHDICNTFPTERISIAA